MEPNYLEIIEKTIYCRKAADVFCERFDKCNGCPYDYSQQDLLKTYRAAYKLFFREVPAKLKDIDMPQGETGIWYADCPMCGEHIDDFSYWERCPHCGQRVEWPETLEEKRSKNYD